MKQRLNCVKIVLITALVISYITSLRVRGVGGLFDTFSENRSKSIPNINFTEIQKSSELNNLIKNTATENLMKSNAESERSEISTDNESSNDNESDSVETVPLPTKDNTLNKLQVESTIKDKTEQKPKSPEKKEIKVETEEPKELQTVSVDDISDLNTNQETDAKNTSPKEQEVQQKKEVKQEEQKAENKEVNVEKNETVENNQNSQSSQTNQNSLANQDNTEEKVKNNHHHIHDKRYKKLNKETKVISKVVGLEKQQIHNNINDQQKIKKEIKINDRKLEELKSELQNLLDNNRNLAKQVKSSTELEYDTNNVNEFEETVNRKLRIMERELNRINSGLKIKKNGENGINTLLKKFVEEMKKMKSRVKNYGSEMAQLKEDDEALIAKLKNIFQTLCGPSFEKCINHPKVKLNKVEEYMDKYMNGPESDDLLIDENNFE